MQKLLRIDSSARINDSHSRSLADEVQAQWLATHPGGVVQLRDLSKEPIEHIENDTIVGYYTGEEDMTDPLRNATAQSDKLIDELMGADALLISTPMYNFTIPSVLKAWIDQVVRIHKTFGYAEDGNLQGMVKNKPAYIATALGAQFTGTPLVAMDFLHPYLKSVLGFIGFEQIEFFSVESTAVDENQFALSKENALADIAKLFPKEVA